MKNKKLMNNNPLISIIVPTYNAEEYIELCLKSIKKQTYSKIKYEVLILDGGSTDKTLEIVRMYKKIIPIRIVGNEKVDAESGKYKGIKESKGEFIILLDSDNEIVDKKWLATGINIMGKHKEGWGLVVIEAASMATPSVVYNVSGLKDSVKNDKTGIVLSDNTSKEMARQAISLYHDKIKYRRFQENGLAWAKSLTWEKATAESLKLLDDTING